MYGERSSAMSCSYYRGFSYPEPIKLWKFLLPFSAKSFIFPCPA